MKLLKDIIGIEYTEAVIWTEMGGRIKITEVPEIAANYEVDGEWPWYERGVDSALAFKLTIYKEDLEKHESNLK